MNNFHIFYSILVIVTVYNFIKCTNKTAQRFAIASTIHEKCHEVAQIIGSFETIDFFKSILVGESDIKKSLDEVLQSQKKKNIFMYMMKNDGSAIFVDTKENDINISKSSEGRLPEIDEKELFHKVKDMQDEVLYTKHVIDNVLYIIAVAQFTMNDFIIICFCKV